MVLPVLPALVAVLLSLGPPSYSMPVDGEADLLGLHEEAHVTVAHDRTDARLDGDGGWQIVDLRSECVPDPDSRCDTTVDCEEGSLNCWATMRPRPPWPCVGRPDGSIYCDFDGNGSEPNETEPQPEPPATPEPVVPEPPSMPEPPNPEPPQPPVEEIRETARDGARDIARETAHGARTLAGLARDGARELVRLFFDP